MMEQFKFNISLSVLNHLGRNLYRSFITVLGEAISNSWDADARNVRIYLDRKQNYLLIIDDGTGMNDVDFQDKFLKIGFSKRKGNTTHTESGRPYIGRKGIGKLALLSCAKKISIITKTSETDPVGGVIDNSDLDKAITDDLTPQEYSLGIVNSEIIDRYIPKFENGTILLFEDIKDGIKNTEDYLKYAISLFFRFSVVDSSFNIYFNDELLDEKNLSKLTNSTQFLWRINNLSDPFISAIEKSPNIKNTTTISSEMHISGFIASVEKPSNLKVLTTDEKASVDLYVNGRLREKDILKHMHSTRIVESYLFGQIHFDNLDGDKDRFTSSREGVVSDDALFIEFIKEVKNSILAKIIDEWDKLRLANKEEGDPENKRITKRDRKSRSLYNEVANEYTPPKDSDNYNTISKWINALSADAQYNFGSYAECFISENLIRKLISHKSIDITHLNKELIRYKEKESNSKGKANISIEIRQNNNDLLYLSMDELAYLTDNAKDKLKDVGLTRDAVVYKPVRDAMAHTALLTPEAKVSLTATFNNIKARIKTLLQD